MLNTQMMAMKITKKTYPIAVACLPGGFISRGFDRVNGRYLIINEPTPREFSETGESPIVVLTNVWVSAETFKTEFKPLKKMRKGVFAPIRRKR